MNNLDAAIDRGFRMASADSNRRQLRTLGMIVLAFAGAIGAAALAQCAATDSMGLTRRVVEERPDGTIVEHRELTPTASTPVAGGLDLLVPGLGGVAALAAGWAVRLFSQKRTMELTAKTIVRAVEAAGENGNGVKMKVSAVTDVGDKIRETIRRLKS